jgi:type I restriction enzyme M protein
MHRQYGLTLSNLGQCEGMVGLIFRNSRNKIRDPAKLRLLVADLIGQTDWIGMSDDLKGDAYEGLLEKNARDTKSGAGQYFTPRGLVRAIVECVDPKLGEVICDPACGTGGFLVAAYEHLRRQNSLMPDERERLLRMTALRGVELVEDVARLAAMNLLLHGISEPSADELPISCMDSLTDPPTEKFDVVLTNPPFGVKGSVSYTQTRGKTQGLSEGLTVLRPDFWVQTANKQLNFLQHVAVLLKPHGRAAVVLPDNVLFEGGAGITVRRRLLEDYDVHTLLRLPRGLFYAQGVAANVIFFDRPVEGHGRSKLLWVYDFRTGNRYSVKTRPLEYEDLSDFISSFKTARSLSAASGRWRPFDMHEILRSRDCSLDLTWSEDVSSEAASATRLDELAYQIAEDLRRALSHVSEIARP